MELVAPGIGIGGEAEDFVDFADDGAGFAFVELAFWIEFAEGGPGAGIAVFLDSESFAGEARQGIDDADISIGLIGHSVGDGGRGESVKDIVDLGGGGLEAGFGQFGGVDVLKELVGGFVPGALIIEAFEMRDMLLETGLIPIRNVFPVEGNALFGHAVDDDGISGAVEQEFIDNVALVFGEGGDLAFEAARGGGRLKAEG